MMRVPGGRGSFLDANARGADIRMVYSPLDALRIARQNPDRQIVFYAIGFETTAPSTALTVLRAAAERIENFSVFCNHVTIIPAIKAILDSPDLRLDAFLGPGHVSTVIGCRPYEWISRDFGMPLVCAGFEPLDLLQSVYMIMKQFAEGRAEVENQYGRVVQYDGNPVALKVLSDVFTLRPFFEWRGLGSIAHSALQLSPTYARYDAELRYELPGVRVADPKACQCGEVLKGVLKPWECKVFGTACTPETPIGTCMVSSEGACAAYYNYGQWPQRLGVAAYVGLDVEVTAGQQDRDPVVADGPRQQHLVAGPHQLRRQGDVLLEHTHTGGDDVHGVALAALDHLGVAGDDGDPRDAGGPGHGGDLRFEDLGAQPLLEHEGRGERDRSRPGHGEVVDGAVHRQLADRAPGEADRADDEGVGGERQASTAHRHQAGVGELLERGVGEQRDDEAFDERPGGLAPRAMSHRDARVAEALRPPAHRLDALTDLVLAEVGGHCRTSSESRCLAYWP
jgi:hydrogenase expression/formation protein HypD